MREVSSLVRSGLRALIVNNFDIGNVTGITTIPTITQYVTRTTSEPYIYLRSESSLPIDINKSDRPRDYATQIEVVTGYDTNEGGPRLRDDIVDEITRVMDRELPSVSGFNVYISVVDEVAKLDLIHEENRTFFKGIVTIMTRAQQSGSQTSGGTTPVQPPTFVFQNFMFTPTSNRIELHDAGGITPATVYPSNNNGFDFTSTTFALAAGSDGTQAMGTVTVDADDVVSITTTINYQSEADATATEMLTATTAFPRIRSLRFGVINGTTIDTTALSSDVQYGTISPVGETVSFPAVINTPSDTPRGYIMFADTEPNLTAINQQGFVTDILDEFTLTTSGGFKIYIQDNPFLFTNTLTAILA